MYEVTLTNKALKLLLKMPKKQQEVFYLLQCDLEKTGPIQPSWPNYSKLEKISHHCHLSKKWVAVWRCEKKSIEVEVYYVGSREDAPYGSRNKR